MIALTKTFGLEHAPRVRANAVAPGPVDTAFLRGGTGRSNEGEALFTSNRTWPRSQPAP